MRATSDRMNASHVTTSKELYITPPRELSIQLGGVGTTPKIHDCQNITIKEQILTLSKLGSVTESHATMDQILRCIHPRMATHAS
jgi:hypothetical protein